VPKKADLSAGQRGGEMILSLQQGLKEDGIEVSLIKLYEWFGVAQRMVYYQATKL
jgi:putative transposase